MTGIVYSFRPKRTDPILSKRIHRALLGWPHHEPELSFLSICVTDLRVGRIVRPTLLSICEDVVKSIHLHEVDVTDFVAKLLLTFIWRFAGLSNDSGKNAFRLGVSYMGVRPAGLLELSHAGCMVSERLRRTSARCNDNWAWAPIEPEDA